MTRMMTRIVTSMLSRATVVCAALALCLAAPSARSEDAAPSGDAAKGKRIYLADGCFLCHGRVGQGGGYNGPVPALAKTELPLEAFRGLVRQPANDMPAYSAAVLSDEQIADIYSFVRSLPGRRDPKSIPILKD